MIGDLGAILNRLPKPVAVVSALGVVCAANAAFVALCGTADDDEGAKRGQELSFVGPAFARACARLQGRVSHSVFRWTPPGGAVGVYDVMVTRPPESGFLLIFDRVDAWIEREEVYQRTRRYLGRVLDNLDVGIVVFDEHGRVTFVNQDQLGLCAGVPGDRSLIHAVGNHVMSVCGLLSSDVWQLTLDRVLDRGETVTYDRIPVPDDEPTRYYCVKALPSLEPSGKASGGLIITQDVTRVAELERELIERERLALVGQMAVTINHEINNPLTVILGVTEVAMQEPTLDAEIRKYLQRIQAHGLRIADMARRMRQLEQIQLAEYISGGPLMLDLGDSRAVAPAGAPRDVIARQLALGARERTGR